MALTELRRARVTKRLTVFCESRMPAAVRDKSRVGFWIKVSEVVLFEERPSFHDPHDWQEMVVAKFKYVATRRRWQRYCQHRDCRWHEYRALRAASSFDRLLLGSSQIRATPIDTILRPARLTA
jgi:hypothetical protein